MIGILLKCSPKILLGGREKAKLMIQILIRPSYFGLGSVHTRQTVLAFMVKTPSCCAGLIGETALFLVSTAWRRRIFLKRNPRIQFGSREKAKLMIQILIRPSYFGHCCCAGLGGEKSLQAVPTARGWRIA